eukprot:5862583-Amphidinium_carterae.1
MPSGVSFAALSPAQLRFSNKRLETEDLPAPSPIPRSQKIFPKNGTKTTANEEAIWGKYIWDLRFGEEVG